MNITDFFEKIKKKENCKTSSDLYSFFGGKKNLKISLRRFYQIISGEVVSSLLVVNKICEFLDPKDQKTFLISYFDMALKGHSQNFISKCITDAGTLNSKNISQKNSSSKTFKLFSHEQLNYLNKSSDAFLIYKTLLLDKEIDLNLVKIRKSILENLIDLDLCEISENKIYPKKIFYKLPQMDNSLPKNVALSSDFILNHVHNFISREGSPDQKLVHSIKLVEEEDAQAILSSITNLKKMIHNFNKKPTSKKRVPIVFVGFSKILKNKDLGKTI